MGYVGQKWRAEKVDASAAARKIASGHVPISGAVPISAEDTQESSSKVATSVVNDKSRVERERPLVEDRTPSSVVPISVALQRDHRVVSSVDGVCLAEKDVPRKWMRPRLKI